MADGRTSCPHGPDRQDGSSVGTPQCLYCQAKAYVSYRAKVKEERRA